MKIFAIIVTYNAMHNDWIAKCLSSLNGSTTDIETVVVDNCSTDGTREYVPEKWPDVVWLPQQKNLGFGQANNVGIRYALEHDADYVLFLNQDAVMMPDAVENMIKAHKGQECILSPVQLNGTGERLDHGFHNFLRLNDGELIENSLLSGKLMESYLVGMVCAACWLIPISVVRRIGGFNPLFFHYGEDDNFYSRMKFRNIPMVLVTTAYMRHDREQHGNVSAFNKRRVYRDLLLVECDINKNRFQRLFSRLKVLQKCYCKLLPKRQYFPGIFTFELFEIFFKLRKIKKSRKIERADGLTWL